MPCRLGPPAGVVAQAGGVGGVVEVGEPGAAPRGGRLQQHDRHLDAAATGVRDRQGVRLDEAEHAGAPGDVEPHRLRAQRQAGVERVLTGAGGEHVVLGGLELLEPHDVDAVAAQHRDRHVHARTGVRVGGGLVAPRAGVGVAEDVEARDAEGHGLAARLQLVRHALGQAPLGGAEALDRPVERGLGRGAVGRAGLRPVAVAVAVAVAAAVTGSVVGASAVLPRLRLGGCRAGRLRGLGARRVGRRADRAGTGEERGPHHGRDEQEHQHGCPHLRARPRTAGRARGGILVLHGHLLREREPEVRGRPRRRAGPAREASLTDDQDPGTANGSKAENSWKGSIVDPGTGGRPSARVTRLATSPTRTGWVPE